MSVWISNCFKKYVSCSGIDSNAPITMGITLTYASEHLHILNISTFSLAYFFNFLICDIIITIIIILIKLMYSVSFKIQSMTYFGHI